MWMYATVCSSLLFLLFSCSYYFYRCWQHFRNGFLIIPCTSLSVIWKVERRRPNWIIGNLWSNGYVW